MKRDDNSEATGHKKQIRVGPESQASRLEDGVKSYGHDNTTNGLRVNLLYDPYSYIEQIHNQSIDYQLLHNGVKCQNIA